MHNNRDQQLVQLRPNIPSIDLQLNMTGEEDFQNTVLRPILKLQNDLLVNLFQQYLLDRKIKFQQMKKEKQQECIKNAIQKEASLRSLIQGCIIGHFTTAELQAFTPNKKALGKRLISMAIQRLQSQTATLAHNN